MPAGRRGPLAALISARTMFAACSTRARFFPVVTLRVPLQARARRILSVIALLAAFRWVESAYSQYLALSSLYGTGPFSHQW